jgi:hypothetical protein
MGRRVSKRAGLVTAVMVALTTASYYVVAPYRREATRIRLTSAELQQSADPQVLLKTADRFYFLNNGPAAAPLYARAEKLFSGRRDVRNELHAKVGRLRSEAESMSFVDLSRFLNEQLQNPIVQADKKLRLWCLIAKGYTDIEIDYRASKRDWVEAQDIAKSLGEDQWVTRASGELGCWTTNRRGAFANWASGDGLFVQCKSEAPESTDQEISEALLGPGAAFAVSHQSDYARPLDAADGQCVGGSFAAKQSRRSPSEILQ